MNTFDIKELKSLEEKGLLMSSKTNDPYFNGLTIYKYSKECQAKGAWNETLINCRGVILDKEGSVIGRPFKKFFNTFELDNNYVKGLFEKFTYDIMEKLDGSMGTLFYYNGKWLCATGGSFMSEQALWFRKKLFAYNLSELDKNCTYVLELIYRENKIVVDYGGEDRLVLLGEVLTETGKSSNYSRIKDIAQKVGFEYPKIYTKTEMDKIIKTNPKNMEGFVIRFSNGEMVKIKLENYIKLHRLLKNITPKEIWKNYLDDRCEFLNSTLEEEHIGFVNNWVKCIRRYKKWYYYKNLLFAKRCLTKGSTRKSIAQKYKDYTGTIDKIYLTMVFNIIEGEKEKANLLLDEILKRDTSFNDKDFLDKWSSRKLGYLLTIKIFINKYIIKCKSSYYVKN